MYILYKHFIKKKKKFYSFYKLQMKTRKKEKPFIQNNLFRLFAKFFFLT